MFEWVLEMVLGVGLAFGTIILVAVLSGLMSIITLRMMSSGLGADWYRRNRLPVDLLLDLSALCLPAVLGVILLQVIVQSLLAPALLLESGPAALLTVGSSGTLVCFLVLVVRAGHRIRHEVLGSAAAAK